MKEDLEEVQKRVVIAEHDILSAYDDLENGKINLVRMRLKPYHDRANEELRLLGAKQPKSPAERAAERIEKTLGVLGFGTSIQQIFNEALTKERAEAKEIKDQHALMAGCIMQLERVTKNFGYPSSVSEKFGLTVGSFEGHTIRFSNWLTEAANRHKESEK